MIDKSIIGKKFGRLTVIGFSHIEKYPKQTVHYYLCRCDCGNEKAIRKYNIVKGITKSCGCIAREKVSKRFRKHGKSKEKIYRIWASIKQRSLDKKNVKKNPKLHTYLNVGISKEWLKFENFYKDMGDIPAENYQMDRIDPYGDYEKSNCRWVTPSENMHNQKRNRELYLTYKKNSPKVSYKIFRRRVREQKWDIEKALTTPKMINQYKFKS